MKNNSWLVQKRRTDKRVNYMMKDNISHWSCTISPAPKNIERKEIESLYSGMEYYKEKGVTDLILQPKFMGSYCAVYLYQDINDTKFFSRMGYLISHIYREKLISSVKDLHFKIIKSDVSHAIVECELMPWSALGKGLIETEYLNYYNLHLDHYNYLENSSIRKKLIQVAWSDPFLKWQQYGTDKQHIQRQYESVKELLSGVLPESSQYKESINLFAQQIQKYGQIQDDFWLEPFNLVYQVVDGEKVLNTDNKYFAEINKNKVCVLDLNDWEKSVQKAYEYKDVLSDIEGIMIKPLQSRILGIPHALKVRTNDYLQMIYGINFNRDYDYYLNKRHVGSKMKASVNDYYLHCALNTEDDMDKKRGLLYKCLDAEIFSDTLDTRL